MRNIYKYILITLMMIMSYRIYAVPIERVDGATSSVSRWPIGRYKLPTLDNDEIVSLANRASKLSFMHPGFQSISTKIMKVCKNFQSVKVNLQNIIRPIFIVGNDEYSEAWIKKYRSQLIKIKAIGVIVKAMNIGDVKRISSLLNGIKVFLGNGDALGERYHIKCYPVLISKNMIEQ